MKKRKIILASNSPRRKELLEQIGLQFEIRVSEYEEDMNAKKNSVKLAEFLAFKKAEDVARHYKDAVVIGSDTFVVFKNKFIGKPKNKQEARGMLKSFSGKKHQVITGFAVIDIKSNKKIVSHSACEIKFSKLSEKEIDEYIKTGESLDKAGAYAGQAKAGVFIEGINGDYYAMVGLPINKIYKALNKFGVKVF